MAPFCSYRLFYAGFAKRSLDYRASPDWGALLGYSPRALADAQHQSVEFTREVTQEFIDEIPQALIWAISVRRYDRKGCVRAGEELQ